MAKPPFYYVKFKSLVTGDTVTSRSFQKLPAARKWAKWLINTPTAYARLATVYEGGTGGKPVAQYDKDLNDKTIEIKLPEAT